MSRSDPQSLPSACAASGAHAQFDVENAWLRSWLFGTVLPTWWHYGANHGSAGGFHDKLFSDGRPDGGPLRVRVQARQTFVYAEAGRLGWTGPWQAAVDHGLRAMTDHFRRPDGRFRASIAYSGAPVTDEPDLYDQAFVLLALAAAWREAGRPRRLHREAEDLLHTLCDTLAHSELGFEESWPSKVPLRANPHMHLLEAMLAWIDAGAEGIFVKIARDIVELAVTYLIDPRTGAIGEFFDAQWRPLPGRLGSIREPGHQFEWAYLLRQAALLLDLDLDHTIARLYAFATKHGILEGYVISATDAQGTLVDGRARLWQQTERLRTTVVLGAFLTDRHEDHVRESLAGFHGFLRGSSPGYWIDCRDKDGNQIGGPSAASSLYHIMTGVDRLVSAYP